MEAPFRLKRRLRITSDSCCVPRCSSSVKFNDVLSFHRFPTDELLQKRWLSNIRRPGMAVSMRTRVCNRHFLPEYITEPTNECGRRRLKRGAMPVLFQWNNFSISAAHAGFSAPAGALWFAVQESLRNGLNSASQPQNNINNEQLNKQANNEELNHAPEASPALDRLDDRFLSLYLHLNRQCLRFVIDFIQIRSKKYSFPHNRKLNSEENILAALAFYAQGYLQNNVSELLGFDEKATGEAVTAITKILAEVAPEFITFPSSYNDRMGASQVFKNLSGIPHVVGVLGHLHVRVRPPLELKHMYENTEGQHSVMMQIIYDADGNLFSLDQCCPGGTHEHKLWEMSAIGRQFSSFQHGHTWVVGSSALQGCGHVLTPVEVYHIKTNGALRFNQAHAKLLSLSQEVFGCLKSRFQCLRRFGAVQSPESVEPILKACCVLHNICKKFSVPLPHNFSTEMLQRPSEGMISQAEGQEDYMKDTKEEIIDMFFNTAEDREYLKAIRSLKEQC